MADILTEGTEGDEPIKLWLDDVRPAPDETWVWVKTVEDAKEVLSTVDVVICSLDHDLGYIADPNATTDPREPAEIPWFNATSMPGADGIDLVKWMCERKIFPPEGITIHSWNPVGAENMRKAFEDAACDVPIEVVPFNLDTARWKGQANL